MPKQQIRWTNEEKERIAEEFVLCRLADPLTMASELFQTAIDLTLHLDRKRKTHISAEPVIRQLIKEKFASQIEDLRSIPIIIEKEVQLPTKSPEEILHEMPLADLCCNAVKRFVTLMEQTRPITIGTPVPSPWVLSTKPSIERRPDKLRVVIIGLMKQQCTDIIRKCSPDIDIRFIDRNKSPHKIDAASTDHVIVYKSSHAWMTAVKASMNGESHKIIFNKDGVSGLCAKIMSLRSAWLARKSNIHV